MRIVASLVLGLFLGFVGAMLQTFVVRVGTVPVPVGAALVTSRALCPCST